VLELLKQLAPRVTRVAVLRDSTLTSGTAQFAAIQAVAPSLGVDAALRHQVAVLRGRPGPRGGVLAVPALILRYEKRLLAKAELSGSGNPFTRE
jgi:hypothetical protein